MAYDLSDYVDVASRIVEFRTKHPDGSLQPWNPNMPYKIESIGDKTFIIVVAAAYRSADDRCPGVGMAWEPYPGKTNYTRDSELQNAETSAWGRAIMAALAADARKGIASQEEVRNRRAEETAPPPDTRPALLDELRAIGAVKEKTPEQISAAFVKGYKHPIAEATVAELEGFISSMVKLPDPTPAAGGAA